MLPNKLMRSSSFNLWKIIRAKSLVASAFANSTQRSWSRTAQKSVVTLDHPDDQNKAIALTAIIRQANQDGLISSPSATGRYELSEGCIDWERTSHKAQRLAPEADMSSYLTLQ